MSGDGVLRGCFSSDNNRLVVLILFSYLTDYPGKLGHILFGHPTTTRYSEFGALYCQRHTLNMDPREVAFNNAIRDLNAGIFRSQRQAAQAYGVPRSSLQERMKGRQPHAIAHQQQQRLTPEQEAFLVDWILDEDSRAQPPSHPRVREMATRLLRMNGDHEPLGQLWIPHFIARNPRVASIVGRTIESARTTAASYETIRAFLELFERTRIELGIQYEDIWNMDETGVALGVCTNSQVVASSLKKKAYIKSPENREWVSIIETISAVGVKL